MKRGRHLWKAWNPVYEAYARAQGYRPAEQLAKDRRRYRGGGMAGFITWVAKKGRAKP